MTPFTLALDQIQKPTWWIIGDAEGPSQRSSGQIVENRKRDILAFMTDCGRPLRVMEIAGHFNLSYHQTCSTLRQMEFEGKVTRLTRHHSDVLWALVAQEAQS